MEQTDQHEDLRVTRTRACIEAAFLRLLRTHTFSKLTVQMIANEAMVNKGTFYHHYKDKFDLADQVKRRRLEDFHQMALSAFEQEDPDLRPLSDSIAPMVDAPESCLEDLATLRWVPSNDVDVFDEIRKIVLAQLNMYVERTGKPLPDIESEAWAAAYLALGFPEFRREGRASTSIGDFAASVHRACGLFM